MGDRGDGAGDREILPADHPLMRRFQQALRDQLQLQKAQLSEEVSALEAEVKEQTAARERLGERLYDSQQECQRQLRTLDACHASLSAAAEDRARHQESVAASRAAQRERACRLAEAHGKGTASLSAFVRSFVMRLST
ncbi:coiled-coil domain-containing protein 40-like [Bacillus rossius redtenbacheri]|uniref:coiled-coil domain-containing protein 40-like n=1 Tax=Bacillus rossius redtenbacheri TaxID=93214 RepID=UPI002FDECAAF